jgi:hypothetical protein
MQAKKCEIMATETTEITRNPNKLMVDAVMLMLGILTLIVLLCVYSYYFTIQLPQDLAVAPLKALGVAWFSAVGLVFTIFIINEASETILDRVGLVANMLYHVFKKQKVD